MGFKVCETLNPNPNDLGTLHSKPEARRADDITIQSVRRGAAQEVSPAGGNGSSANERQWLQRPNANGSNGGCGRGEEEEDGGAGGRLD